MDERFCIETLGLHKNLKGNQCYENKKQIVLVTTPDISSNSEHLCYHSNGLARSTENNDSTDLLCFSDEDSSLFETEHLKKLTPFYVSVPSIAKLKKIKEVLSEVNAKYLDWKISEIVLNKYKIVSSEMPSNTEKKVKDIITSSSVQKFKIMKNRRGESFSILGLEEADFDTLYKKSLLSSEKKELTSKMMILLTTSIQQLNDEKDKLKGIFGSHCLKVTPGDTALSEERVQQAQMIDELKLRLDHGHELLVSDKQIMQQLAQIEVNATRKLQNTSYLTLKDKTRHLSNNLRILRHKIDQISLADVNHTRSINTDGESLRTSVDSLNEKRKSLLKMLEKYGRKEKASKTFSDIVAEYSKTQRQLYHKQQTLKILNEPDESFS